jgi:hypothetical protein
MRLYCAWWFSLVKNHNPNQSETVIRKETNGAASESLTASLIDNNLQMTRNVKLRALLI